MNLLVPAAIVVSVIGIGIFTLLLLDHKELVLEVQGESAYTVEYGEEFRPPEAGAFFVVLFMSERKAYATDFNQ